MDRTKVQGNVLTVLGALFLVSCGGVEGGKATGHGKDTSDFKFDGPSRYSIKAYVPQEDGEYELLQLSPENVAFSRQQQEVIGDEPEDQDSDIRRKSKKLGVSEEQSDGSVEPWQNAFYEEPTLHHLAKWAYEDCGNMWFGNHVSDDPASYVAWPVEAGGYLSDLKIGGPIGHHKKWYEGGLEGSANSGTRTSWYVGVVRQTGGGPDHTLTRGPEDYNDVLSSCDSVLAMQSQLLCTAGKLVEIAESFATTRLQPAGGGEPILVPPQASRDRFLIRRLAMETLASFAHAGESSIGELTDYTSANPSEMQRTCGWALGYAHNTSSWSLWNSDYYQLVFDRGWLIDVSGLVPFRQFPPDFDSTEGFWAMGFAPERTAAFEASFCRESLCRGAQLFGGADADKAGPHEVFDADPGDRVCAPVPASGKGGRASGEQASLHRGDAGGHRFGRCAEHGCASTA